MKRALTAVVVVAALVALPACAKKDTDKLALKKIIDGTAELSDRFVYEERADGQAVLVRGLVEDDFRYKARLTVDGRDVMDQVVADDALAVRFLDASFVNRFVKADPAPFPESFAGLQTRRWVLDAAGAPPLGVEALDERVLGVDPIVDSLTILAYVQEALSQSERVVKFNSESLDYRPTEDPFPRPANGSDVERWDLIPPKLPRPDAQDSSGQTNARLAQARHFRKMSIYVKDKHVVQVRERIGASGTFLESLTTYVDRLAREAGARAEAEVKANIDRLSGAALADFLLLALNAAVVRGGEEPIRFRDLAYVIEESDASMKVDLPTEAVLGKLTFFGVNATRTSADGSTTTTTATTAVPS